MPRRRDPQRGARSGSCRRDRDARSRQMGRSRDLGHRAPGRACLPAWLQPAAQARLEGTVTVVIRPGEASLADWRAIVTGAPVAIDPSCSARVAASAAAVNRILSRSEPVYGINTGFGKLASVRIAREDLAELQRNIVLSHAAGVGEPAPVATTRLMMALKLGSLAQGASGVQPRTLEFIEAGLKPIALQPKEGLALLNGTQFSTASALSGLFMAETVFRSALATGALS